MCQLSCLLTHAGVFHFLSLGCCMASHCFCLHAPHCGSHTMVLAPCDLPN
ncbi:unnamed protein product [Staurois parvus]|uniref:Uncharacterized protein n=1 Tax=Staurois parvus TaxID=386267 RepID=A0ABN9HSX7_9NEOB|nr:unnamed protein product [Staurois parvus]